MERAIDIVKYSLYARPTPTEAEKKEATRMVINNPEVWDDIMWGDKQ
jgi:hypothetical protein